MLSVRPYLVPRLCTPLLFKLNLLGCQICRLNSAQAPGSILTSGWKNSSCCCPTVLIRCCHPDYSFVVPNLVTHSDKWTVWHIPLFLSLCLGYFFGAQALRGWGHSLLKCLALVSKSPEDCVLFFDLVTCKWTSPGVAFYLLELLCTAYIWLIF